MREWCVSGGAAGTALVHAPRIAFVGVAPRLPRSCVRATPLPYQRPLLSPPFFNERRFGDMTGCVPAQLERMRECGR